MVKQNSLGQFEQLILTAILTLGDNAYGVTICAKAEELPKPKSISLGPDRMEDKGLVTSWLSDPTPERGGRAKRHYRLKKAGETALRQSAITARRICDAVEESWGEKIWNTKPGKWKPARQS
jgi:PadR family transcriptional regulator PadR